MTIQYTENDGLELMSEASRPDEAFDRCMETLDIGRMIPVDELGENVTQYQPGFVKNSDDLGYVSDGNDTDKAYCMGLYDRTASTGAEAKLYGLGSIVKNAAWDWDLTKWVFVADDKTLSQTPGTIPVPVGMPLSPTRLLIVPGRLLLQQAHIADPASAAALTQDTLTDSTGGTPTTTLASIGTSVTDPADAPADADALREDLVTNTIPSIEAPLLAICNAIASIAAQMAKVKTDVAAVRTGSENNKSAIDSILVRLEQSGIDKTS